MTESMGKQVREPGKWCPALVALLHRRPELLGVGYTDVAREVSA